MINPFTGKPFGNSARKKVLELPASDPLVLLELRKLYKENDVIIIHAATGSGKSVVVATEIMLIENVSKNGEVLPVRKVIMTEPRSLNTHVADFLNTLFDFDATAPDRIFGRAYRNNDLITPTTRLDMVTDGYLVNFIDTTDNTIIIDEVHTRNTNIDMLMGFCKNKNNKLILMSATMDPNFYANYFNNKKVGILKIPGVAFPVKDIFLKTETDYVTQAANLAKTLEDGNVLIFLSSASELKKACQIIKENCYELHKGATDEVKNSIITKSGRKVIFSTNIAESGITMPNLSYVIDSGRSYKSIFNSKEAMEELIIGFVSRAEIQQRRGRVGRVAEGVCYHLYTEEEYENFVEFQEPEIVTTEISSVLLFLLKKNIDAKKFLSQLPNPPQHVEFGLKMLKELGLYAGKITPLGEQVAAIGTDPAIAICLLKGKELGVSRSICMILAMVATEPELDKYFYIPHKKTSATGEVFIMKKMLGDFLDKKDGLAWCKKNGIHFSKMSAAKQQFFKLQPGHDVNKSDVAIKQALCAGFPLNIAVKNKDLYEIDRPVKFIKIYKPNCLSRLSRRVLFLSIRKIGDRIAVNSLVNL